MEANSRSPYTSDVVDPLWRRVLNERFTILEPIGSGGMGRVYKAIQSPLDRIVALKVLNPSHANGKNSEFRQRFFLEASLTSKLHHPNTITVIDYGHTPDGIFYIAMEYLEGQTLSQLLTKSGAMHWTRCLVIAEQICRSLREAHRLRVIHRDLKPSNVMLLSNYEADMVKVLDFGLVKSFLAKNESAVDLERSAPTARYEGNGNGNGNGDPAITDGGMFLGSPQYMAPEQSKNQADHRSDIYSLGATLYHMIAGRPPFWAKDSVDVILKHLYEPVPRIGAVRPDLNIPPEVEALVMKCLEKDPAQRFPSMDAILEVLRQPTISAAIREPVVESAVRRDDADPPTLPGQSRALETTRGVRTAAPPRAHTTAELLWRAKRAWVFAPVALSLLFILVFVLWRGRGSAPAPMPSVVTQAATQASSFPAESTVVKPKTVKFVVASEPPGATLSHDGKVLGVTPVSFNVPADAEGKAEAELKFTLKGYHPMIVITGGSNEIALTQRLQPHSPSKEESGSTASRGTEEEELVFTVLLPEAKEPPPAPASLPAPASPPPGAEEPKLALAATAPAPSLNLERVQPAAAAAMDRVQRGPVEFNDRMTPPRKISGPDPQYTDKALDHEVEGLMEARCIITVEGTVTGCRVVKGVMFMDRAVISALQLRRYTPALLQGKPVEVYYTFSTTLKLPR